MTSNDPKFAEYQHLDYEKIIKYQEVLSPKELQFIFMIKTNRGRSTYYREFAPIFDDAWQEYRTPVSESAIKWIRKDIALQILDYYLKHPKRKWKELKEIIADMRRDGIEPII